jgi:hypothetical protein
MYAAEQLFCKLTYEEVYYTLRGINENDCYFEEFLDSQTLEDFLYLLEMYEIVYLASDGRVLLTNKGEKILQYVSLVVEMDKFRYKVKKTKL